MIRNYFFLVLLFTASIALAQTDYSYLGAVFVDDEPLVGATITPQNGETTLTDDNGVFQFVGKRPATTAVLRYLGFKKSINLTVEQDNLIYLTEEEVFEKNRLDPVFISAKYPVTQTTVGKEDIESQNLGQDIPILLEQLPSVVSTSDAGAGIGYSGLRVRGSDASRVNVTVNDIPLSDSESQLVFWVNMPDFASSTDKITLVRGVGTSTNGAGAFGASLHLQTGLEKDAYAEYNGSYGSFNTFKNSLQFGTGTKNGWTANARLSKIESDGYIDRATADLQSYFVNVAHEHGTSASNKGDLQFITFKGHEKTYQAWYGVSEQQLAENRTFNPYNYENQVDNYTQGHYQLLLNQNVGLQNALKVGLHYTKGQGYFEEFKEGESLSDYGLDNVVIGGEVINETNLVRRRWLDNDFFGIVSSFDWENGNHYTKIGGSWNKYLGGHFGEIIRGEFVPTTAINENYYDNDATKQDATIYAKYTYDLELDNGLLRPFADLQFRSINYDFVGLALDGSGEIQNLPQNAKHNFVNPKLGLSYEAGNSQVYASFSRAQKEPNRNDYTESPAGKLPVAEELNDFELGYGWNNGVQSLKVNGYFMDYKNQLAITGGVNDVGEYSRQNVDDSYRAGIELEGRTAFGSSNQFQLQANATFSQNRIKEFTERIDNFDVGGADLVVHKDTDLALSPSVIAGANFTYAPSKDFSATLISKFVGDQFLDNTSSESRKLDSYWVNNINLSGNLGRFVPSLSKVELNVLVNNILNETYESNGYTFGYIYGGEATYENYYYPQAGTNALVGLRLRID